LSVDATTQSLTNRTMKRRFLCVGVAIALATLSVYAQNDTTRVESRNVKFEKVAWTNDKTNEVKQEYYVTIDGKTYKTTKTSAERFATIVKFGGTPCVVKITNKSNTDGRIAVL